jgi:cytoskeletal protein CcmA (bactofilin family)
MWWTRKRASSARSSDLTAFVDEGSEFEGKYTFRGTAMLNGKFTGEITSTDTLIIGEKANVNATIRVGTLLVSGEVVGTIVAGDRLELHRLARVFGDVETPVLVVEDGAMLEGHCRMTRSKPTEAAPPARDLSIVSVKR